MRRTRRPLFALLAAAVLAASACGVTADTSAATLLGHSITVESVEQLARDEGFIGAGVDGLTDSSVPGDVFRNVLQFELQRVAWIAETDRWGLEITDGDRATAREQVTSQLEANGLDYEPATHDKIVDFVAAQGALNERFSRLDPEDDGDLRLLYEGSPTLWDQVCAAVAYIPDGSLRQVRRALRDGTTVEELPDVVDGATLAVSPDQQCVTAEQLPDELDAAFQTADAGHVCGPVVVTDEAGTENRYVFRIDERRHLGFSDARDDLASIAASLAQQGAQAWIALVVASADIDPRFGSGVTINGNGEPVVAAPPTPGDGLAADATTCLAPGGRAAA